MLKHFLALLGALLQQCQYATLQAGWSGVAAGRSAVLKAAVLFPPEMAMRHSAVARP